MISQVCHREDALRRPSSASKHLHKRGHAADVRICRLLADGADLLSGGSDETLRLWDAATGQPRAPPYPDPILASSAELDFKF
jgi:WD40 repeat protein